MLDPGDAAGEPIFVPRSASAPEGDGYIIALVYRAATNTSELLILYAQDIAGEPAAVLKLPRRVPAGLHGDFVAAWYSSPRIEKPYQQQPSSTAQRWAHIQGVDPRREAPGSTVEHYW
jgi:hypothetical protein